jgi:hypothetical protein
LGISTETGKTIKCSQSQSNQPVPKDYSKFEEESGAIARGTVASSASEGKYVSVSRSINRSTRQRLLRNRSSMQFVNKLEKPASSE